MTSEIKEKEQFEIGVVGDTETGSIEVYDGEIKNVKSQQLEGTEHAVGLDLFQEVLDSDLKYADKEYSKIRRKIDTWLLPVLCITYMLQFLDKLSLNYASAYSMKEDLGLVGNEYGNIAAIFNVGYLIGSIPANYVIQNFQWPNTQVSPYSFGQFC